MKKHRSITSFALALLVAVSISISSTNVQAVELTANQNTLTGTNIVYYAKQFIGTPYKRGGTTTSGFDCSGFTMYVYNHFDIKLPHSAKEQTAKGTVVSKSNLQVGDLVFFGKSIYHVGVYIGNGNIIHSPKPGSSVKIVELKYMPDYNTARRIAQD